MAAHASARRTVDERALQTNQVVIISLVSLAFVIGDEAGRWVIVLAGVSMAIGAAAPGYGPIQLFYRHVLKRFGIVKPDPQPGDPAPHRFAQTLGAGFLLAATVAFFTGAATAGYVLAAIVLTLALVNLSFHFCAGCFVFLHIARVRGHVRAVR